MTNTQDKNKDKKIELEGVIKEETPQGYLVESEFRGIKLEALCYVSGKMKKKYIQVKKGDRVRIAISMYDIGKGIITYRLTDRKPVVEPSQETLTA